MGISAYLQTVYNYDPACQPNSRCALIIKNDASGLKELSHISLQSDLHPHPFYWPHEAYDAYVHGGLSRTVDTVIIHDEQLTSLMDMDTFILYLRNKTTSGKNLRIGVTSGAHHQPGKLKELISLGVDFAWCFDDWEYTAHAWVPKTFKLGFVSDEEIRQFRDQGIIVADEFTLKQRVEWLEQHHRSVEREV